MAAKSYSERVMRFRKGVYQGRGVLTPGCQVLLLRLSDDMSPNAIVSIPRSTLTKDLDCAPPRITEWINQAVSAGYLSRVRRGRPGVTAVYQGMFVTPEVREGVPSQRYAPADHDVVREGVPQIKGQRYARADPQEVVGIGTVAGGPVSDVGSDEKQRERIADTSPADIEASA